MRLIIKKNPKSIVEKSVTAIMTIVFLIAFMLSLFVFGPLFETFLELQVCQPNSIVKTNNGRGKAKTIICIDKKTGNKIDASHYQYFYCCPPAIVIFLVAIYGIFVNLLFRNSRNQNQ
ncbi:MAG: hypothetical protein K1X72_01330 [Pyrinomonadaceae bacterium]|nr:hypothetical protein [Pyrinomonadaceae bacterium]